MCGKSAGEGEARSRHDDDGDGALPNSATRLMKRESHESITEIIITV